MHTMILMPDALDMSEGPLGAIATFVNDMNTIFIGHVNGCYGCLQHIHR